MECDVVLSPWTEVSVLVYHFSLDETSLGTAVVHGETDMVFLAGCANRLFPHGQVLLSRYHPDFSRMIGHTPDHVVIMVTLAAHALTLTIDKEFHLIRLIIVAPHVDRLPVDPVPMREEMKYGLRRPLALIHIIDILWKTSQVDDAEIAAACGKSVGRRLPDIVEARPDELPANERRVLYDVSGCFVCRAPSSVAVVVGRTHHRRIRIGQIPPLGHYKDTVGGHAVEAACLKGRDSLGHDEGLCWEILRHVFHPLAMIVEADDVERATLEKIIVGRGFVATRRDRTRRVEVSDDLGQTQRNELIDVSHGISRESTLVVTGVENKIGLLKGEIVGGDLVPLFQHLVAYRPYQDAGMIAVAHDEVG